MVGNQNYNILKQKVKKEFEIGSALALLLWLNTKAAIVAEVKGDPEIIKKPKILKIILKLVSILGPIFQKCPNGFSY